MIAQAADAIEPRRREDWLVKLVQAGPVYLWRLPPRLRTAIDVGTAVVVALITVAGLATSHVHDRGSQPAPAIAYPIVVLGALALAFRHRRPRATLAAVLVATFVNATLSYTPRVTAVALAIAFITFGSRTTPRTVLAAAAISFVTLVAGDSIGGRPTTGAAFGSSFFLVAALSAISLFVGTRRAYVEQLRQRAVDLERERELLAERAVADERVRIARELHDAVAHHVSLLVVQAGAIRESLPPDAPQRGVADSMAATGRQALREMRNMLGLLRPGDGAAPEREPQPGVAEIGALLDQTRAAGVEVDLTVEGDERELPVGVDLSAYRIVQESLTNVVRHAGPARASVVLRYRPDALELTVRDDGKGAPNGDGSGHGLVGMRERAALFGGELSAGPEPDGGWRVHAILPLEAPA